MMKCPLCYGEIENQKCHGCGVELNESEMTKLKAKTYDSIIAHLFESGNDERRRERIRTKIALKNIKNWAIGNKEGN